MDLPPSKLSSAASRVWSESAGQFHKKTDVKIDLGLQTISSSGEKAGSENAADKEKASTSTISSGYVFGSRVFERVSKTDSSCNSTSTTKPEADSTAENNTNTTTSASTSMTKPAPQPLDVSSIFRRIGAQKSVDSNGTSLWKTAVTANGEGSELLKDQLSESAKELAKKGNSGHVAGAEEEQPEITTGEEMEKHLLQINCKFYQFNADTKEWQERGMGTLRLNQHIQDRHDVRLVGRQSGSQRVLINSKIFPEMLLEELSEKRLKISAQAGDSDKPQLFLVQASPASIANMQALLREQIDIAAQNKRARDDEEMAAKDPEVMARRKRRIEEKLLLQGGDLITKRLVLDTPQKPREAGKAVKAQTAQAEAETSQTDCEGDTKEAEEEEDKESNEQEKP